MQTERKDGRGRATARPVDAYSKTETALPRTLEDRNAMIEEYLPLVKYIASRIAGRLPSHVEIDDLINAGVIGLIDAIEKFDPTRKIKFKTYAEFRIKGAILDELRALDWVPRSTRQKATRLERAFTELEQQLGRVASDPEVVEHMGISFDEYNQMVVEARGISLISLDELHGDSDENTERNLLELLADPSYVDPAEAINLDQVYRIVAESIDMLPEKERLVISLYYYDELTMKEIGEILEITESRVSQIHTKAILRLRGRLLKTVEL
ncbi:FliA/WhiG family RNA polymerase sigma factor [Candidatus Sumerlaeota bacterium]|nr:FliA/WhiG family RNA polymerase sigma factor [Candidatus Sumerlaeota bacterium]